MDRSYYSDPHEEKGIQQDAENFTCSMCNFIAIFQNAFYYENGHYASRACEVKVLCSILLEPDWGSAGLSADRSEAFVMNHGKELKWLKQNGFLEKDHSIEIVRRDQLQEGHWVCQLVSPSDPSANHFINVKYENGEVIVTHDGYRDSWLAKHGQYGSFRRYCVC